MRGVDFVRVDIGGIHLHTAKYQPNQLVSRHSPAQRSEQGAMALTHESQRPKGRCSSRPLRRRSHHGRARPCCSSREVLEFVLEHLADFNALKTRHYLKDANPDSDLYAARFGEDTWGLACSRSSAGT